mgnify:FL=1
MSFPNNDKFWLDTVKFLNNYLKSEDKLLAPTEFGEKIDNVFNYSSSRADNANDFQWVILHKGRLNKINSSFLERIAQSFSPVFANEVFVVFSSYKSLKMINKNSLHVKNLWEKIKDIAGNAKLEKQSTNRSGAYLGDYRYLTTTLYGNKIFLDTRDMTLTPHIIMDGMWESWISKCVINYLQPGMRVVEVGSNLGWYTLLMANQIGSQGKLIAFEANKDLVKLTVDSICINGYAERVKLHNIAASEQSGEMTFYIRERHLGNSSVAMVTQELLDNLNDDIKEVTVPTVALDEFLSGDERKIDFMKIDAEGSEPSVFRGMKQLLEENQGIVIVMEYSPHQMRNAGFDPVQEMLLLFQFGFDAFKIEENGTLTQVNVDILTKIDQCELLLTRSK